MSHSPAARPTLRLLSQLTKGWDDAAQFRAVEDSRWDSIQPLSHLRHPVLIKCRETMESEPNRQIIGCSGELRLTEIRTSQWRAGVWTDPHGIHWVLSAGLAKGGHLDHEDFYQALERQCSTKDGRTALLPTDEDKVLLARETLARVSTEWELVLQEEITDLLGHAVTNGCARRTFTAPCTKADEEPKFLAEVELELADEDDVESIVVRYVQRPNPGSPWDSRLEYRLLITLAPPEPDWDVTYPTTYSAMEEHGFSRNRLAALRTLVRDRTLSEPEPLKAAHYAHRPHIGDAAVDGQALRALCGIFFVPQQDAESLPRCSECDSAYSRLPAPPDATS